MPTTHLYVGAFESRSADDTRLEYQCGLVERMLGGFLDGDQNIDGYSIDATYLLLKAGMRPGAIYSFFIKQKPTWAQVVARAEAV